MKRVAILLFAVTVAAACDGVAGPHLTECTFALQVPGTGVSVPDSVPVSIQHDATCSLPPSMEWASADTSVVRVRSSGSGSAMLFGVRPGLAKVVVRTADRVYAEKDVRADIAANLEAAFQTSALHYVVEDDGAGFRVSIPVRFTNRSGAPLYIVNCHGATGLRLERWTGLEWRGEWSPIIPLCLSPPIIVSSGEVYLRTIVVFGGYPGSNLYPQFASGRPSGVFRLVWSDVLTSFDANARPFGEKVPMSGRISNAFLVE